MVMALAHDSVDFESLEDIRDLARWEVSTCKPGNGVNYLYNNDFDTFWQTDGDQPHFVNLLFPYLVRIKVVSLYVMQSSDESYTPHQVQIRAGSSPHDLQEVITTTIDNADGWMHIPLNDVHSDHIAAQFLQIKLLANYMNGKDARVRQIGVYSLPKRDTATKSGVTATATSAAIGMGGAKDIPSFSSTGFQMFGLLR